MPNYYAHLQFGALVLAALPESLRMHIGEETDAYTLGQYGPDPLYFYRPIRGGAVRAVGRAAHRQPARGLMERCRQAVGEGRPFALGYTAGLLCHFALDSRCHAYISTLEESGKIVHSSIETEFDRFLMARGGLDPARETPMPVPELPGDFDELLERYVYPGIKGYQYREGLSFFCKASRWHTRAAGRRHAERCWDLAARTSHSAALFRDMVLKREPEGAGKDRDEKLLALLQEEVPVTVEKLGAFLDGRPLDPWFDRDFRGRTCQSF